MTLARALFLIVVWAVALVLIGVIAFYCILFASLLLAPLFT